MTNFIILIGISLLPIIFLLWYFDRFDSQRKESRKFLWKIFAWGLAITLIAAAAELTLIEMFLGLFTSPLAQLIVMSFLLIAGVEEALKYWVVKKIAYKSPYFDEHIDGIIYGVTASLGFAALENILYVVQGGVGVGILRAFTAVPAHAFFGVIMGYYISKAKFSKSKEEARKNLNKGLIYAIALHGLYDFFLLAPEYIESAIYVVLVIPLLIGMYTNVKRKLWKLQFLDKLPKAFEVKKWTKKRWTTYTIGLIIITWTLLSTVNYAFYFAEDANVDSTAGILVSGLLFIGSLFLIREKRPTGKKTA